MKVRVIKDFLGYRPQIQSEAYGDNWVYLEEKGWFKKVYYTWFNYPEHGSVFSTQEAAIDCLGRYMAHLETTDLNRYSVVYEADWS